MNIDRKKRAKNTEKKRTVWLPQHVKISSKSDSHSRSSALDLHLRCVLWKEIGSALERPSWRQKAAADIHAKKS